MSADTDALLISRQPHTAEVVVRSHTSEEPVTVPVRVRVVAHPAPLIHRVFRPLVALLLAGVIGGVLGWLLGRTSPAIPAARSLAN